MKRIDIDGKSYRMRRGKLVEIPKEWVGRVVTTQKINKRPSKLTGKVKRVVKNAGHASYKDSKQAPLPDDE